MKFETAALTTKAMELWSLSTKEKSFKYHNSTQDYSPPPILLPLSTHEAKSSETTPECGSELPQRTSSPLPGQVAVKGSGSGSSSFQIFLICTPSCERLTAGSYLYSSAKSLVYIGCECVGECVRVGSGLETPLWG